MDHEFAGGIARAILDGANLERQVVVDVYDSQSTKREPTLREDHDDQILVEASNPSELRRFVGRYAVRESGSFYKWCVVDRPYLAGFIGFALIMNISALQFLLGLTLTQHIVVIAIVSDTAVAMVVIGFFCRSLHGITNTISRCPVL